MVVLHQTWSHHNWPRRTRSTLFSMQSLRQTHSMANATPEWIWALSHWRFFMMLWVYVQKDEMKSVHPVFSAQWHMMFHARCWSIFFVRFQQSINLIADFFKPPESVHLKQWVFEDYMLGYCVNLLGWVPCFGIMCILRYFTHNAETAALKRFPWQAKFVLLYRLKALTLVILLLSLSLLWLIDWLICFSGRIPRLSLIQYSRYVGVIENPPPPPFAGE